VVVADSRDRRATGNVRGTRGGPRHHRTPVWIAPPIELLHRFGGFQTGRTFLIDRRLLIEHLRRLADGEEFQRESRRKERLSHTVDQLRRQQTAARVKISVEPDVFNRKLADLSPGVALEAGHLHIAFSGTEDLLSKLFALSQAASNDFDRFRAVAESAEPRSA
jgi:hypothetical protein